MLNSPLADDSNSCNLFGPSELGRLQRRDPKLMALLRQAHQTIVDLREFLTAYTRLNEQQLKKLISTMEVRAIMHAFDKKVESRASYKSFLHALESVYEMAKTMDPKIPVWPRLAAIRGESSAKPGRRGGLQQINLDGTIGDPELKARGYDVGTLVRSSSGSIYKITRLVADLKSVETMLTDDQGVAAEGGPKPVEILRTDLVSNYTIYMPPKMELLTSHPCPSANKTLRKSIIEGQVKQAMMLEFAKANNAEKHTTLQKYPVTGVVVNKSFGIGKFHLVPLTTTVVIDEYELDEPWIKLGSIDDGNVYMKSCNSAIKQMTDRDPKTMANAFVSKFFMVQSTPDHRLANCEMAAHEITISIGQAKVSLELPLIINTKALKDEELVKVLTVEVEPSAKRAKVSPKAKGKTKRS